MKLSIAILLFLTIAACNKKIIIGTCVQKADSLDVFQITAETNNLATLEIKKGASVQHLYNVKIDNSWIETECPKN